MNDISVDFEDGKFNYRAALLIEKDDKVYVECNPEIDYVTLPGGRVKLLESSTGALRREIYEEMGILLNEEDMDIKSIIENFFEFDNKKIHELYFLYVLKSELTDERFKEGMKNKDSEYNYYRWVKKEDLAKEKLLPEVLREVTKSKKIERVVVNNLK